MDFDWGAEDQTFRRELRAFLAEALPADWDEIAKDGPGSDAQAAFAREFCPRLAARGWLVPHWPSEHGGAGASAWQHAILGEEMWRRGEPRGSQYMNVNWIGPTILRFGSAEQRARHVPPIAAGRAFWCQGFSEPEAGSDLAALRTQALRDGDAYVVNGSKIWTSYANQAEHCFLLARSDPASRGRRGLSVLLVPMHLAGIEVREIPSVVGERYFFEVFFRDVRVPEAFRLGPEHGGWDVASWALAYERVGAARYARAARTLDALAERARARGLLAEARVQERLGEARALCEAARLLAWRVIDGRAKQRLPTADTNVARIAGTAAERAVAELAQEIFGPEALEHGHFADAHFRLAMTAGVAVGASEIHLNLVAGRFLGLPRE